MNTRAKGNVWERKVKKYLQELGFFVVKQSNSQFPDLICIPPRNISKTDLKWIECGVPQEILFVECKSSNKGKLNGKEINQMKKIWVDYKVRTFVSYPKYSVYSGEKNNIIFYEIW